MSGLEIFVVKYKSIKDTTSLGYLRISVAHSETCVSLTCKLLDLWWLKRLEEVPVLSIINNLVSLLLRYDLTNQLKILFVINLVVLHFS